MRFRPLLVSAAVILCVTVIFYLTQRTRDAEALRIQVNTLQKQLNALNSPPLEDDTAQRTIQPSMHFDYSHGYKLLRSLQATPSSFLKDAEVLAAQQFLNRNVSNPITVDDILLVIMGSSKNPDRIRTLKETWLGFAKNYFIFSDQADPELGMITLPSLKGKPTYEDAQHRQMKGLQYLLAEKPEELKRKWVLLVDDDTWLNVPAVLEYLSKFDTELPMIIGWIHMIKQSFFSGGAGMIFSKSAIDIMVPKLYTKDCPFDTANDITISQCAYNLGVLKVKCQRMSWSSAEINGPKIKTKGGKKVIGPSKERAQIAYHWVKDKSQMIRLTCLAALQFRIDDHPWLDCDSVWETLELSFLKRNTSEISPQPSIQAKTSEVPVPISDPETKIR